MNIEKISRIYKSKTPREKIMLAGVLWIAAIFWTMSLSSESSEISAKTSALENKISVADTVISQEVKIKTALAKIRKVFDPKKTVSETALQLETEKCATEAGLEYTLSAVSQKDSKDFRINSIVLNCRNAEIANISKFEKLLRKNEPYLFAEKISYTPAASALSVKYSVVSIELKSPAADTK